MFSFLDDVILSRQAKGVCFAYDSTVYRIICILIGEDFCES